MNNNPYASPCASQRAVRDYSLLWRAAKACLCIGLVIFAIDVGLWLRFDHATRFSRSDMTTAQIIEWFASPFRSRGK